MDKKKKKKKKKKRKRTAKSDEKDPVVAGKQKGPRTAGNLGYRKGLGKKKINGE